MSIISATANLSATATSITSKLGELQVQLATGKKAQTYVQQSSNRSLALAVRDEITISQNYSRSQDIASTRLSLMQSTLSRVETITSQGQLAALGASTPLEPEARTAIFTGARLKFNEMVSLLNERGTNGEYLFAGRNNDKPPVTQQQHILFGDGTRAGLQDLVDERRLADAGDGLGRLDLSVTGNTIELQEDGDHPFGIKIGAIITTGTGIESAVTGTPSTAQINFTSNVESGAKLIIETDLPDGSSRNITLTAASSSENQDGVFSIGANIAETVANFYESLQDEISTFVNSELRAASSFAAATSFFNIDNADSVPTRVDGDDPATATGLRDATSFDTVTWYQGDRSDDNAGALVARVGDDQLVVYGLGANEPAFRDSLIGFAVGALEDAAPPDDEFRISSQIAVGTRMRETLSYGEVEYSPRALVHRVGLQQSTVSESKERIQAKEALLNQLQADIETTDTALVGAEIIRLQTLLQASYSATASISRISLINYL